MATTTMAGAPAPEARARERAAGPLSRERCDGCGYRAYVLLAVPVPGPRGAAALRPLAFCRHHFARHETKLTAMGAQVMLDARPELEAAESRRAG